MSLHTYLMIKSATTLNNFNNTADIHSPSTKKQRAKEDKAGNPYPSKDMVGIPGYGYFAEDYPTIPGLPFADKPSKEQLSHISALQRDLDNGDVDPNTMLFGDRSSVPGFDVDRSKLTSTGWYDDGFIFSNKKPIWGFDKWNWAQDGKYNDGWLWDTPKYGPDDKTYDTIAKAIAKSSGDAGPMFTNLFQNDFRTEERDERLGPDTIRHISSRIPLAEPALRAYRPELFE